MYLINLILTPIDAVITQYLPALNTMLANVADFFTLIFSTMGWAVSVSGIPSAMWSVIVSYYIFVLTVPFSIYIVKLAIRWYHYLKP